MSMKKMFSVTILPQPESRFYSKTPVESKEIPVIDEFDLGTLDYKSYKDKISNLCNYFPKFKGNNKLWRTLNDVDLVFLKPNQQHFFLKFVVPDAEPVYLLFCMKKAWLIGVKVGNKFVAFESKEEFKSVVPLLKESSVEEEDIGYKYVKLDPGNVFSPSYIELQKSVIRLSNGFEAATQGHYAHSASGLLGFSLASAVFPGMFREMRKLFSHGRTGVPDVPESVKSTIIRWSDISEYAFNGGKCHLFSDELANEMCSKSGVSRIISIVKASKFNKKNPVPKINRSTIHPMRPHPLQTVQIGNVNRFCTLAANRSGYPGCPSSRSSYSGSIFMFGGCLKISSCTVQKWVPRISWMLK